MTPAFLPHRNGALAFVLGDELDWQLDAACADLPGRLFFPERGEPSLEAKATCRRCPVREPCLDYALAHHEKHGVWGGLSARQRQRLGASRAIVRD